MYITSINEIYRSDSDTDALKGLDLAKFIVSEAADANIDPKILLIACYFIAKGLKELATEVSLTGRE